MWVPEELKVNKFKDIRIPSGAEYLHRPEYGQVLNALDNVPEGSASVSKTKLDSIAEDFDRIRQEIEDSDKSDE